MSHSTIRVFHIIKSLGRGGAEMLLPAMYRIHDRERFEFGYGYFLPWKNQVANVLKQAGAEVHCFQASNNIALLFSAPTLMRFFRTWKPSLLHCHLPWAGLVGRLVGKIGGIPVLYTEHNKQERYHWITRLLNRLTFSFQAGVIAVSREVADSIHENIGDKTPVHIIENGVDIDWFRRSASERDAMRSELGIPEGTQVVGLVAVFRVQKRLVLWLETAAEIIKEFPAVKFVLVGEGPCRSEVEQSIQRLGLEDHVILPGIQSNTRPYFAAFDLFLMTSEFEGLPIALLEAMAMECPVVATRAGGISEVVNHEGEGLLYPVDVDAGSLSAGCVDILKHPDRARQFAIQGRRRVAERHTVQSMTRKVEALYLEIESGKRHGYQAS